MDTVLPYLLISLAVLLLGLVGGVALVRGRRGQRPQLPESGAPQATLEPPVEVIPGPTDELRVDPGTQVVVPAEPSAPALEVPAPTAGRMVRLRARLARSQNAFGRALLMLLSSDQIDEQTWEDIEALLLQADLGVTPTEELVGRLRTRVRVDGASDPAVVRKMLGEELLALVNPALDRSLTSRRVAGKPAVMLVVGVNGTGKTTTTGKLARVVIADGGHVVLGAADTFRAAAAEQLTSWGERVGAQVVRGAEGADPAAVAYDAVRTGMEMEADVVIIDTAGRLHTKVGLMDELGKVKRVIEKQAPVSEVLLVLDATTGQNGLNQARVFADVVAVTGLVLTKLDGTAKGGIVVAVQRELGVPVKLVGLGEGPDDLAPFVPEDFVKALLD